MTVKIKMQESDLVRAKRGNPLHCPVAKALTRHFDAHVSCGFHSVSVNGRLWDMNEKTTAAIKRYDYDKRTKFSLPHTIVLSYCR